MSPRALSQTTFVPQRSPGAALETKLSPHRLMELTHFPWLALRCRVGSGRSLDLLAPEAARSPSAGSCPSVLGDRRQAEVWSPVRPISRCSVALRSDQVWSHATVKTEPPNPRADGCALMILAPLVVMVIWWLVNPAAEITW